LIDPISIATGASASLPARSPDARTPDAPGPWYGLDIETDTTIDGLDPARSGLVAVALTDGEGFELVVDGDEPRILTELDHTLAGLEPGIIVTWNGAAFDLPFIADRARQLGITTGLRLRFDPLIHRRDPLPGHDGAYRARWYDHRHIDGYQLFRADVGAAMHLPCGLKALAAFVGLPVVEVDRSAIHELDAETTRRYVASDARLARSLVLRRVTTALSAIDVMPA
jgi:DNA polymerase elongation subunit (family B)